MLESNDLSRLETEAILAYTIMNDVGFHTKNEGSHYVHCNMKNIYGIDGIQTFEPTNDPNLALKLMQMYEIGIRPYCQSEIASHDNIYSSLVDGNFWCVFRYQSFIAKICRFFKQSSIISHDWKFGVCLLILDIHNISLLKKDNYNHPALIALDDYLIPFTSKRGTIVPRR